MRSVVEGKMIKRSTWLIGLLAIASCAQADAEVIRARDGASFSVERQDMKDLSLPTNSDLKLVDGDLARYASKLCQLDDEFEPSPARCDVFVQADAAGALIGYAALRDTAEGVKIVTNLATNRQRGTPAKSCWIAGTVYENGSGYEDAVQSSGTPFEGQLMYSAWERSPGDFLLSEVNASSSTESDPNSALGVWYLYRTGNKLRIEQERWNYCYKDVAVDEVFDAAISLVKITE